MAEIVIPTDYAWSTWTLSDVTDNTTSISLTSGKTTGTATSPSAGYDATSGNRHYKIAWTEEDGYGISGEARTADTSAGIASATWFDIRNGSTYLVENRKRFMQVRFTFTVNADATLPKILTLTMTYNDVPLNQYDNDGFNYSAEGARPTKDGKFAGRYYQCSITGLKLRRHQMVKQRGKLVSREYAYDVPQKQWAGTEKYIGGY
uniref:Uncharacterized protein n=1 Tax=viral metagenome TaxID=1070528 RepID=A0A6H1ZC24_9ZZZZ